MSDDLGWDTNPHHAARDSKGRPVGKWVDGVWHDHVWEGVSSTARGDIYRCLDCTEKWAVPKQDELRQSREETMMQIAEAVSRRGTCNRLYVGCVIARSSRAITTGYNGRPSHMPHCNHQDDKPCLEAVHAEANAIAFAARYGTAVEGAELYSTHQPCLACSQLIINAGIMTVWYWQTYRDPAGVLLLEDGGIDVRQLTR